MKVLYAALLYNYGKPEEGNSYEHHNLEAGFRDCAEQGMFEVEYFYPDKIMLDNADPNDLNRGKQAVHDQLLDRVQNGGFDAIFHVSFNEHIDLPENVLRFAAKRGMVVMQWDCDSSWRFHNFILGRKEWYTHFVTTHSATIPWYEQNGMKVIRSQWGGSPLYVRDENAEKKYDVSFIGQKHGIRPQIVEAINNAGIDLHLFGSYWEGYPRWGGYIKSFSEMLAVFNQSRICLNMSNPWHVGTMPQIKGRHFEIPQAGGFQLATPADDLQRYFTFGEEISIANSVEELCDQIKHYLGHSNERQAIAEAGYQRMQNEHQWSHRFKDIFVEVGLL